MAEERMNLAALQQRDPYISEIVDTASQVAVYLFNTKANAWEKLSISGSLFFYKSILTAFFWLLSYMHILSNQKLKEEISLLDEILNCRGPIFIIMSVVKLEDNPRHSGIFSSQFSQQLGIIVLPTTAMLIVVSLGYGSASPENGFMILNRLGLNNLVEPITKYLDFHRHDSFLLYRNTKEKVIYGVWFYDEEECKRIDKQLTRYVKAVMEEEEKKAPSCSGQGSEPRKEGSILSGPGPGAPVDIMQMLSKAQHEYNTQGTGDVKKKTEPKPMIDNPNASATKKTNLIRPMPLKMPDNEQTEDEGRSVGSTTPGTATISLDALFRTASLQQEVSGSSRNILGRQTSTNAGGSSQPEIKPTGQEDLPPLLRQIMSTGSMVEDIERPYVDKTDQNKKSDISLGGSLPVGLPDVTQPPPGHPAYRGPSPREQRSPRSAGAQNIERGQGGVEDQDISSKDSGPVKFGLPGPAASPQILSGNLLPQFFNLSTSQSSQSNTHGGSFQTLQNQVKLDEKVSPRESGVDKGGDMLQDKSDTLLTPADLLQSSVSVTSVSNIPPTSSKVLNTASAVGPSLSTELLSPMVFVTGRRPSPTAAQDSVPKEEPTKDVEPLPIVPLTKEQLKQAMLYLIKNDSGFVSTLHEAYLKSLQELSGHKT